MTYNSRMKKKTRKAIVLSIVYLIITWIISSIISNTVFGFFSEDWLALWLISFIPVAIYWAKKFIDAGTD